MTVKANQKKTFPKLGKELLKYKKSPILRLSTRSIPISRTPKALASLAEGRKLANPGDCISHFLPCLSSISDPSPQQHIFCPRRGLNLSSGNTESCSGASRDSAAGAQVPTREGSAVARPPPAHAAYLLLSGRTRTHTATAASSAIPPAAAQENAEINGVHQAPGPPRL